MKIAVTGGKTGQLRYELGRTVPEDTEAVFFDREELDITRAEQVQSVLGDLQADCIINAAAYTAVDKAESEREAAFAVNQDGVRNLSLAARDTGARLIHISTDFVFDGQYSRPYPIDFSTCPLGVYGESKRAGEQELQSNLGDKGLIVRTSWVYSSYGSNFVKTMLRLMNERDELGVIADQVGTPTWANGLAQMLWAAAAQGLSGIHHWTDAGVTSWYDFAYAIYEEASNIGSVSRKVAIRPLKTEQYPTPAKRPAYSVLDKSETWSAMGKMSDHWRVSLRKMLQEL